MRSSLSPWVSGLPGSHTGITPSRGLEDAEEDGQDGGRGGGRIPSHDAAAADAAAAAAAVSSPPSPPAAAATNEALDPDVVPCSAGDGVQEVRAAPEFAPGSEVLPLAAAPLPSRVRVADGSPEPLAAYHHGEGSSVCGQCLSGDLGASVVASAAANEKHASFGSEVQELTLNPAAVAARKPISSPGSFHEAARKLLSSPPRGVAPEAESGIRCEITPSRSSIRSGATATDEEEDSDEEEEEEDDGVAEAAASLSLRFGPAGTLVVGSDAQEQCTPALFFPSEAAGGGHPRHANAPPVPQSAFPLAGTQREELQLLLEDGEDVDGAFGGLGDPAAAPPCEAGEPLPPPLLRGAEGHRPVSFSEDRTLSPEDASYQGGLAGGLPEPERIPDASAHRPPFSAHAPAGFSSMHPPPPTTTTTLPLERHPHPRASCSPTRADREVSSPPASPGT
jgi:hypothetical protein